MLQAATGLLVIIDAGTATPFVFWRGLKLEVCTIVVAGNTVLFRVLKDLHSIGLLEDLRTHGIKIKEVMA